MWTYTLTIISTFLHICICSQYNFTCRTTCSDISTWLYCRQCSVRTTHPFCPSRTTLSASPSLVLIHLTPCNWGSIIRGHLSALVRIVAFSMDMRSLGRFSLFQRAIVAPSVRRNSTSKFSVIGMGGWVLGRCNNIRCCICKQFRTAGMSIYIVTEIYVCTPVAEFYSHNYAC